MNNPLVSIIIPVYNAENYLSTCINSVLSQTYTDFECILINDGSTDSSGEICDHYQLLDERIKVVHKENGGVSSARNKGLDMAKGEWVVCVDSDDWIEKEYINQFIQASFNTDMVIQGYFRHFGSQKVKKYSPLPWQDSGEQAFEKLSDLYQNVENVSATVIRASCAKIFKKQIIDDNHLRYRECMQDGEDTLFSLSYLFYVNTIRVISFAGYHYMTHQSGLTKTVFDIEKFASWHLDIISAAIKIGDKYRNNKMFVNLIIADRIEVILRMCYLRSYVSKEKRLKILSLIIPLLNAKNLKYIGKKYTVLKLHSLFSIKTLDAILFFYVHLLGSPARKIYHKLTGKKYEIYKQ